MSEKKECPHGNDISEFRCLACDSNIWRSYRQLSHERFRLQKNVEKLTEKLDKLHDKIVKLFPPEEHDIDRALTPKEPHESAE